MRYSQAAELEPLGIHGGFWMVDEAMPGPVLPSGGADTTR